MQHSAGTSGPDEERPSPTPYIPESDIPTVTVPLPPAGSAAPTPEPPATLAPAPAATGEPSTIPAREANSEEEDHSVPFTPENADAEATDESTASPPPDPQAGEDNLALTSENASKSADARGEGDGAFMLEGAAGGPGPSAAPDAGQVDGDAAPAGEDADGEGASEVTRLDLTPLADSPGADPGIAGLVESVVGALTEQYEALEERLRESPEGGAPVGWAPQLAALRAFREGRVAGDWDVLARLLVSPGSLGADDGVRLVRNAKAVRRVVKELLAAGERALLLAPAQERAAELLRGFEDDPEVFGVLVETRPEGEPGRPAPMQEMGSNGTIEFKPVGGDPAPVAEPAAAETWVRDAVVRPVGDAWRQAWQTEVRLLRRGLMWLEQWPRDAAALEGARAECARRRDELERALAELDAGIEEARRAAEAAEAAAGDGEAEAERLEGVLAEAEAELAGPRAEADRLQGLADAAAAEAGELTRVADAAFARCAELDQRGRQAQAEVQAARRLEESLTGELTRAREALPAAAAETERLRQADADAAAEGHTSYYRLVSAESALAARKRTMTLGQRLHVAAAPSEFKALREEVRTRTREADEAAKRAQAAKDAAEQAAARHQGIAAFVSEGGARLEQAREAQARLGTELVWLAAELEKAKAAHQEQARLAAESVDRATQAGMAARAAQQAATEIQARVDAARTARDEALAAAGRARAEAEAATARGAELEAAAGRRKADAAAELAAREAELRTAVEAEERSRENVREICGGDPSVDPALIATHERRAMARIEQLTGYLEGGAATETDVLLRAADVVAATPLGAGVTVPDEEFDALIVADAEAVPDAAFLIGAVRARRWILVGGAPGAADPGPFTRAGAAAPHLLEGDAADPPGRSV
ncbi:hypothetical protein [Spirillospora albida]|uniref:hypothetical protein n=1 Tax=Spirillospora albida TaxID=58123 RepID=UPI000AFE9658|nr:hypothetical protein [Spirillospora albida]